MKYAEQNREAWHAGGPFNVEDGSPKYVSNEKPDTTVFDSLKNLLDTNKKAVVLNAGKSMGLGFVKGVREEYVERGQFIDVGIAEENAVAMSSGIAKNGGTAVFGTFAPFFQRTYDQMSHDLCLNDSPATMLVLIPGVYGMNSNTHIALCDIQMFAHIPNLIYLAPTTKEEYNQMFKFATTQKKHPVGIRVPATFIETGIPDTTLRYYERIGLLVNVPRNKNGMRNYDESSCKRIEFIKCMRSAGVEIEILIEYMSLLEKGKATVEARKKLLEEQREKLLEKQKNINQTLERLNYKIGLYKEIAEGKRKDFTE